VTRKRPRTLHIPLNDLDPRRIKGRYAIRRTDRLTKRQAARAKKILHLIDEVERAGGTPEEVALALEVPLWVVKEYFYAT